MSTCRARLALVIAGLVVAVAEAAALPAASASQVAAGWHHACALTTGGGVTCWGYNSNGQLGDGTTTHRPTPVQVSGLSSGVAAIAAGVLHTCALTTGGAVKCWGGNWSGQLGDNSTTDRLTPTPVSGLGSGVKAIAAGNVHSCALTTGGGVKCWGGNSTGQLGDGSTTRRLVPTNVSGLGSGIKIVTTGDDHTCAVTTEGVMTCWGKNTRGQLGDNTTTRRLVPTAVSGLESAVKTADAGQAHTCAVTTAGAALCWGANGFGQLGDGSVTDRWTPTAVSGLGSLVDTVAAGDLHTCALKTGGGVVCWGENSAGQTGDGTTSEHLTPTAVSGLASGVGQLAAGGFHTCAVATGGSITCWGSNIWNELGDGTTTQRTTPTPARGLSTGIQAIAAGYGHTCVLTTTGGVWCVGSNSSGQLGDGTRSQRSLPTAVLGLGSGVQAIAAGHDHTCALSTGGGVVCWGDNSSGQLGDNTTAQRLTPTAVSGLATGVRAIAAGERHTCARTTDDAMLCWGGNEDGQLGDGTKTTRLIPTAVTGLATGVTAIATGGEHTCALTTTGGVKCWGSNGWGQVGDGTTTERSTATAVTGLSTGVKAITTGDDHTCAVTTTGAAKCWGCNQHGRLGDGTTTQHSMPTDVTGLGSGVDVMAAGSLHTCALTVGGGVTCWGRNERGQLGDGTTTDRPTHVAVSGLASGVSAVATGQDHTCALVAAGVTCWGNDRVGALGTGIRLFEPAPHAVYGFGGAIALGSIAPTFGPPAGGTAVSIIGTYLLEGALVTIGGVAASNVAVMSPTEIFATTGAHALGTVDVVVRNPDLEQAVLAGGFTYGTAPPPTFADDPLQVRVTHLKAAHVLELRNAVSALRTKHSLAPFPWTDAVLTPHVVVVKAVHLTELRTALGQVYVAAGRAVPTWSPATLTPHVTIVAAASVAELRAAVLAIW